VDKWIFLHVFFEYKFYGLEIDEPVILKGKLDQDEDTFAFNLLLHEKVNQKYIFLSYLWEDDQRIDDWVEEIFKKSRTVQVDEAFQDVHE